METAKLKLGKPEKLKMLKKSDKTEMANTTLKMKGESENKADSSDEARAMAPAVTEIPETFKEHYGLLVPFSHAAIVEDEKNEVKYSLVEPTLTELDKQWVREIKNILWDELSLNSKGFKDKKDAEEFLKLKILETSVKYKIDVDANTLGKYQYYITRDFLGFGKIDGIMIDENIEDVSCDGINSPVFVWHRKYESIPSNVIYDIT